ncbi:MAG: hypothetical protein Q7S79_01255 [bacterium]|nr:hypothetical protein [bacterium]
MTIQAETEPAAFVFPEEFVTLKDLPIPTYAKRALLANHLTTLGTPIKLIAEAIGLSEGSTLATVELAKYINPINRRLFNMSLGIQSSDVDGTNLETEEPNMVSGNKKEGKTIREKRQEAYQKFKQEVCQARNNHPDKTNEEIREMFGWLRNKGLYKKAVLELQTEGKLEFRGTGTTRQAKRQRSTTQF